MSTKKTTTASTKTPLTKVQHRVLVRLAQVKEGGSLDRTQLREDCFNGNSVNLKKIMDPLLAAKLVAEKVIDTEDVKSHDFRILAAGRKAAAQPRPEPATSLTHKSLPKVGGTFTKTYKGKDIVVTVLAEGFKIGKTVYTSLTKAAMGVRGSEMAVNGWAFFGLVNTAKE